MKSELDIVEEQISFDSEGLALEGVLAYPEAGLPRVAVLLLTPHPHMGGKMTNNVIQYLAQHCAARGALTLRFNYRGVGESKIDLAQDESRFAFFKRMEEERRYDILLPDAMAAWDALRNACSDAPRRIVIGYSLGALLAGMMAAKAAPTHVVALSPPVNMVPLTMYDDCVIPKLFVAGDNDFAFDAKTFRKHFDVMPEPKVFLELPDCDHFFRKAENRLYDTIVPYLFGTTSNPAWRMESGA